MTKRAKTYFLTLALLVTMVFPAAQAAGSCPFTDVPENHWAYAAVCYLNDNKLMTGETATTFCPNGAFSRAMFVTVLGRMEGIDTSTYSGTSFQDVPAGSWCAPYVKWATEQGIVNGYDSRTFGPNDSITREQYCTIVCRYFKATGKTPQATLSAVSIRDESQISSYAADSVRTMTRYGLIDSYDGVFAPNKAMTRVQVASTFCRVYGAITGRIAPQVKEPITTPGGLCAVDYLGMTVNEVAEIWGSDFVYMDGWFQGDAKGFHYEDKRIPYIFNFNDANWRGYALGTEPIALVEIYEEGQNPSNIKSMLTPELPSDVTYTQLKQGGFANKLVQGEEADSGWGETGAAYYQYTDDISFVFNWYNGNNPYTTPVEGVFIHSKRVWNQPVPNAYFYQPYELELQRSNGINYSLYDIDHNGVKELFILTGDCEANYMWTIYTIVHGKLLYIDQHSGGHGAFSGTAGAELYFLWMHMGAESASLVTLENNELRSEELYYGNFYDADYDEAKSDYMMHLGGDDFPYYEMWDYSPLHQ